MTALGSAECGEAKDDAKIVVDVELRADDFVEYLVWRHYGSHSAVLSRRAAKRRAKRAAAAIILTLAAAVGLFFAMAACRAWAQSEFPYGGFWKVLPNVLAVLFLAAALNAVRLTVVILSVVTAPGAAAFARRRRAEGESLAARSAPFRMTFGPEGVEVQAGERRQSRAWTDYVMVHETPTLIVSRDSGGTEGFTPKRIFGDAEAIDNAMRRIDAWAAAKGAGRSAVLQSTLSEQEHHCPRCRYSLAGLAASACPECGLPLDPDLLFTPRKRWWARRCSSQPPGPPG